MENRKHEENSDENFAIRMRKKESRKLEDFMLT